VDNYSFEKIKNNPGLLAVNLHSAIYKISPPMDLRSDKACQQFLKIFNFNFYRKGKVLQIEKTTAQRAYIIIEGDVMTYKKLYRLLSKTNDE
jgi:hypothetical protein